ncbi:MULTISPECIES: TetR/AcrR family transcriptional regulator C-terminal domain-containing protein [Pseudonocardia]|uniref:TetR/AcrR family transcriptional regulator C-terminal domain-containing protein n=1 Tax=Pseudonocardia TaxID=1847 RepID=UPI001E3E536D|nr:MULTISPECIES: TetR/AcrR family transcriptional regulator C-terminal domain-containing protein [Pseudonocardia]
MLVDPAEHSREFLRRLGGASGRRRAQRHVPRDALQDHGSEFVYAALAGAGFTGAELTAAAAAVSNLVIGSVAAEASWQHDGETAARHAVHEHLQANAHAFPAMAELSATSSDWTEQFTHSVEILLTGLTAMARP